MPCSRPTSQKSWHWLLEDTSATKVTLPFVEERQGRQGSLGNDFWSYGVGPARKTWKCSSSTITRRGCRARLMAVEELFHQVAGHQR